LPGDLTQAHALPLEPLDLRHGHADTRTA
jgi:hypothetical protein